MRGDSQGGNKRREFMSTYSYVPEYKQGHSPSGDKKNRSSRENLMRANIGLLLQKQRLRGRK